MSGGRGSRRHRTTPLLLESATRRSARWPASNVDRGASPSGAMSSTAPRNSPAPAAPLLRRAWCTTWMNESGSPKRSASSCATRAAVVAPAEPSMPQTTAAVMPEIFPCFRIRSASPCRRRFATGAPPYRRAVATSFARRGRTLRCRLGLDQTAPDRVASQLDAIGHAEFVEDVRAVALDRLDADEKLLRDLL